MQQPASPMSASTPPLFHPAVARWFASVFEQATAVQAAAWPAAQGGGHVLLAAPTGSGKTLAAFLMALDSLVREAQQEPNGLPDETRVVYVSPLRALSNDVEKNLIGPLAGIRTALAELGLPDVEVRTALRTGDTPAAERTRINKKPPHIYVTTPESLYILLTSESGRKLLSTVRTIIVDEIHALIGDKRGSHLALSLERLAALTGRPLQRIGVSATQKPIEEVARFLTGSGGSLPCTIVNAGHVRERDLAIEVPASPLEAVMSGEVWEEVYSRIVELVNAHRTTLVFVNTRRLCERLARRLADQLGDARATSHHGSLSREHRLRAEQQLKSGELAVLVATASLELGIDIGDVDLVIQIGSTRSISAFLQRVGRSGHSLRAIPKGRIFPLSRDELCESVALLDAVRREELDQLRIPIAPLDILAQQIVAASAAEGEWGEDELFVLVRQAYPYRDLSRAQFDAVVEMLAHGFATARGRRGAHLHRDQTAGKIRPRRGARLAAITSGGAIPDLADYEVVLDPEGLRIGSLNEDFAIESMVGDIFQLGNQSYVIRKVEPGRVRVADARGAPPTIPFWLGEAPARSAELSFALARLRKDVVARFESPTFKAEAGEAEALRYVSEELGVNRAAAEQLVTYLSVCHKTLGAIPTDAAFVMERFFDETGGMHLVIHAPLGARINRAWGLTLRKCFCRKFDFELQAAANDDAIILSLGPTHSFQLEEVWRYVRSNTARDILIQALLVAPLFGTRWRWNAQRALAVLRFRGGGKVPPRFQRMDADDLLTVCFPDQVACAENLAGEREIPDHPLVNQTVTDATTEAMDAEGLLAVLRRMEAGSIQLVARDLTEASPMAANILTAKPYSFLDDAPLEERRTQAVFSRRWLDAGQAKDLAALDPAAIQRVVTEAWPDPRNADELLDALDVLGFMTAEEGQRDKLLPYFQQLGNTGRATRLDVGAGLWVSPARLTEHRLVHPEATFAPPIRSVGTAPTDRESALRELVRSRIEALGPVCAHEIAQSMHVAVSSVERALLELEAEGVVFKGQFRPKTEGQSEAAEWCERRLLARIHRATLDRLRSEIEPVTQQDFMRFLLRWQRVEPEHRAAGAGGLAAILEQLEGYEAAAVTWESELLPSRLDAYDPFWLDTICLSGRVSWLRRSPARRTGLSRSSGGPSRSSVKATPVTLVQRARVSLWRALSGGADDASALSSDAENLRQVLLRQGASFYDDLERGSGLLRSRAEEALAELVTRGQASSDAFGGLRALLIPASQREAPRGRRGFSPACYSLAGAGRWTLLNAATTSATDTDALALGESEVEALARVLLKRWGVVFRSMLDREGPLPPWRELLRCYRKLEAQGELRGGRFVAGFSGEQYALPEAVSALRDTRRAAKTGANVIVSGSDPLNLVGVIAPGRRVPAHAGTRVLYRDGIAIAAQEGTTLRSLFEDDSSAVARDVVEALTHRRRATPTSRAVALALR